MASKEKFRGDFRLSGQLAQWYKDHPDMPNAELFQKHISNSTVLEFAIDEYIAARSVPDFRYRHTDSKSGVVTEVDTREKFAMDDGSLPKQAFKGAIDMAGRYYFASKEQPNFSLDDEMDLAIKIMYSPNVDGGLLDKKGIVKKDVIKTPDDLEMYLDCEIMRTRLLPEMIEERDVKFDRVSAFQSFGLTPPPEFLDLFAEVASKSPGILDKGAKGTTPGEQFADFQELYKAAIYDSIAGVATGTNDTTYLGKKGVEIPLPAASGAAPATKVYENTPLTYSDVVWKESSALTGNQRNLPMKDLNALYEHSLGKEGVITRALIAQMMNPNIKMSLNDWSRKLQSTPELQELFTEDYVGELIEYAQERSTVLGRFASNYLKNRVKVSDVQDQEIMPGVTVGATCTAIDSAITASLLSATAATFPPQAAYNGATIFTELPPDVKVYTANIIMMQLTQHIDGEVCPGLEKVNGVASEGVAAALNMLLKTGRILDISEINKGAMHLAADNASTIIAALPEELRGYFPTDAEALKDLFIGKMYPAKIDLKTGNPIIDQATGKIKEDLSATPQPLYGSFHKTEIGHMDYEERKERAERDKNLNKSITTLPTDRYSTRRQTLFYKAMFNKYYDMFLRLGGTGGAAMSAAAAGSRYPFPNPTQQQAQQPSGQNPDPNGNQPTQQGQNPDPNGNQPSQPQPQSGQNPTTDAQKEIRKLCGRVSKLNSNIKNFYSSNFAVSEASSGDRLRTMARVHRSGLEVAAEQISEIAKGMSQDEIDALKLPLGFKVERTDVAVGQITIPRTFVHFNGLRYECIDAGENYIGKDANGAPAVLVANDKVSRLRIDTEAIPNAEVAFSFTQDPGYDQTARQALAQDNTQIFTSLGISQEVFENNLGMQLPTTTAGPVVTDDATLATANASGKLETADVLSKEAAATPDVNIEYEQ